jgi:hypothetical protein
MAIPSRVPNPANINGDAASQRCAPASMWSNHLDMHRCRGPADACFQAGKIIDFPVHFLSLLNLALTLPRLARSLDSAASARSGKATVMATHKQSNSAEIADAIGVNVEQIGLICSRACAPRCREFFFLTWFSQ